MLIIKQVYSLLQGDKSGPSELLILAVVTPFLLLAVGGSVYLVWVARTMPDRCVCKRRAGSGCLTPLQAISLAGILQAKGTPLKEGQQEASRA